MLDRSVPPTIHKINSISLPPVEKRTLKNGIPLYILRGGSQEVVQLNIVFRAGRLAEKKHGVAKATASLLKEGSANRTGGETAELIDFLGGSLRTPNGMDNAGITLFCLSKHFEKLLGVVVDLLESPAFPETELETYIRNCIKNLKIDEQKGDIIAYREISRLAVGDDHPYGYNSEAETYAALKIQDLKEHFEAFYTAENCHLFFSGKIEDEHIELIENKLVPAIRTGGDLVPLPADFVGAPGDYFYELADNVQSSIRIGRPLFGHLHPDFPGFQVLNTILGGYFGSRLMSNIREEKGYTYNIFSTLETTLDNGWFYIGTEVANEKSEDTLKEIYLELDRLKSELVPEDELEMVRNYMVGNMLGGIDGPFSAISMVKTMILHDLPADFLDKMVKIIQTVSAEELRTLAQRYFVEKDFIKVMVGPKSI